MQRNLKLSGLLTLSVAAFAFTGCVVVEDDYVCDDGEILIEAGDISCNGHTDCYDGSDEIGCGLGDYTCDDGEVRYDAGNVECDGIVDCYDRSDEVFCATNYLCANDELLLGSGNVECDGTADCIDSSDEVGCGLDDYTCADGEVLPAAGDVSCDDVADCVDLSDELGCDTCLSNEIICLVEGLEACAPVCDTFVDCDSEIDEDPDACL